MLFRSGVDGHPLKRQDSPNRDESGQHQHQEPLSQRRLDYSMDHSVVMNPILARVAGMSLKVFAIRLALQRVRKLQEQAAISDDPVAGFQPAGNLRLPTQTFSKCHRPSAKLV